MRRFLVLGLSALLVTAAASTAQAALRLTLASGADFVDQTNPGGIPNIFVGSVGGWSVNVTTGINGGGPLVPNISLDTISVTSVGNAPLTIMLTSNNIGAGGYTHAGTFDFAVGGTTEGIVTMAEAFLDDGVGASQSLATLGPFGPPVGTGALAYSDQTVTPAATEAPGYTAGIVVTLDHLGTAGITKFGAQLKAVPEPSAMLYGGLVACIAGLGYRGRQWFGTAAEEVEA